MSADERHDERHEARPEARRKLGRGLSALLGEARREEPLVASGREPAAVDTRQSPFSSGLPRVFCLSARPIGGRKDSPENSGSWPRRSLVPTARMVDVAEGKKWQAAW